MREEKPEDVQALFKAATRRKEEKIRYHLLAQLLRGEIINLTKNDKLFVAVNRERLGFETILNLHPEEVKNCKEEVKVRREQQKNVGGRWYNPGSKAWWGQKGVVPACCFHARPSWYWKDKKLMNSFLNSFPIFRIKESML